MNKSNPIGNKINQILFVILSKPATIVFTNEGGEGKTFKFKLFMDFSRFHYHLILPYRWVSIPF